MRDQGTVGRDGRAGGSADFYRHGTMGDAPVRAAEIRHAFFMAKCPHCEEARVMTAENDFGEWIRPQDALAKWMRGQILMATPILHTLRSLASGLPLPWAHEESPVQIEMRAGIVLIPLRTPTLPPATHTNCYVIGGDHVIVIDPAS